MQALILAIVGLSLFASLGREESGEKDPAKEAQNPLANVISMPLQSNTDFGIGPRDRTAFVLNVQPIYPVSLGNWTLINRMIVPLPKMVPTAGQEIGNTLGEGSVVFALPEMVPDAPPTSGRKTGVGDITLMNWFSPPPKGSFMWGVGPVTIFPTATDSVLGTDKFSIGPSAVLVLSNPKFIAASVINAWWSVGGDSDAPDVGVFYWQPIFTYFLPNRWYVVTAPILLSDLEADSGQKWIVPLGGGVGKMFNAGKLPMDLTAQAYKYVEKPDGGPDWVLRLQLKFIFPK